MAEAFTDDHLKYVVLEVEGNKMLVTERCDDPRVYCTDDFSDLWRYDSSDSNEVLHEDIVRHFLSPRIPSATRLGAGRIYINRRSKTITAYDYSSKFGPANTQDVANLLSDAREKEGLQDFTVNIFDTIDNQPIRL